MNSFVGLVGGLRFNGKVGTVVGSKWKGQLVMRSAPGPRKGKPSKAQTEQQVKFGFMIKFLQPLIPLLNESYKKLAVGMTGINSAISDNNPARDFGSASRIQRGLYRGESGRGKSSECASTSLHFACSWTALVDLER